MGPARAAADFTAEATFGAHWLLRMWDDRTQDALLPGRDRRGQRADRRRPRHLAAAAGRRHLRRAPTRPTATSATGRCSGPGRRARRSAPTWPAATPPRFARVLPGVPDAATRRWPARCLRCGRAHLRARGHRPGGPPADGDPVRLLPGDGVARRPRAGARPSCTSRPPRAAPAAGRLPHRPRYYLRPGRALGARVHHRARTTPPTRSTCTTSAASRTTTCTGRSHTAGDPRGLADDAGRRCSPTCEGSSTGPSRRAPATRSGSGSRGPRSTRRRTGSGCR